jgi:hypothetical protein
MLSDTCSFSIFQETRSGRLGATNIKLCKIAHSAARRRGKIAAVREASRGFCFVKLENENVGDEREAEEAQAQHAVNETDAKNDQIFVHFSDFIDASHTPKLVMIRTSSA